MSLLAEQRDILEGEEHEVRVGVQQLQTEETTNGDHHIHQDPEEPQHHDESATHTHTHTHTHTFMKYYTFYSVQSLNKFNEKRTTYNN